jgi:hypothetical protein
MKTIVLLSCFLVSSILVFSQDAVKKTDKPKSGGLYMDASAGMSFPLGDYASTDVKHEGSGAKNGFLGQVNLDWMGKNNWGLGIQYTFQYNKLQSSVENETLTGMNEALGSGAWTNHYLMAGLTYLNFFKKVYFEGKGLFGFVASSSPLFKTTDPDTKKTSSNVGVGIAYGIQFGAGYAVSKRVTVKASVEYLAGIPKINKQSVYQTYDTAIQQYVYSAPVTVDTKRNVSAFIVKAGVVVRLSK